MWIHTRKIEYHTHDTLPENENPWMNGDMTDFLYHLWFDKDWLGISGEFKWKSLSEVFWDVTHVCMWGSHVRAQRFSQSLNKEKKLWKWRKIFWPKPIWKTERFSLYKVWNTISVSHWMGMPSMSILLHEISKMLYYAKWRSIERFRNEVNFIRMWTSWGLWNNQESGERIWVEGGTVVISTHWVDQEWEERNTVWKRNERWEYPTQLDDKLSRNIKAANVVDEIWKQIHTVLWKTMWADCFYEAQWRLDWFFDPWYSEEEKIVYLNMLYEKWVRNIEMEAGYFSSFCLRAWIPWAIVCVALLNRLEWDQVRADLDEISENAEKIVLNYLRKVQAI